MVYQSTQVHFTHTSPRFFQPAVCFFYRTHLLYTAFPDRLYKPPSAFYYGGPSPFYTSCLRSHNQIYQNSRKTKKHNRQRRADHRIFHKNPSKSAHSLNLPKQQSNRKPRARTGSARRKCPSQSMVCRTLPHFDHNPT